jgi:hypothetical protein
MQEVTIAIIARGYKAVKEEKSLEAGEGDQHPEQ